MGQKHSSSFVFIVVCVKIYSNEKMNHLLLTQNSDRGKFING